MQLTRCGHSGGPPSVSVDATVLASPATVVVTSAAAAASGAAAGGERRGEGHRQCNRAEGTEGVAHLMSFRG